MSPDRKRELKFLIQSDVPVILVDSRPEDADDIFDDHYTVTELVEQDHLRLISAQTSSAFVRARCDFRIYVTGDVYSLETGQIFELDMGVHGNKEIQEWLKQKSQE